MSGDVIIGISGKRAESGSVDAIISHIEKNGFTALLFDDHTARNPQKDIKDIHAFVVMGNDHDIDPERYIDRYPENDPRRAIHPHTRNESLSPDAKARGDYEDAMIEMALKMKMPLLGICGGMQRINVICGGTLHQHVPDMVGHERLHQLKQGIAACVPTHPVLIECGTRMSIIASDIKMSFVKNDGPAVCKVIMENSLRHQSIDIVGDGLIVSSLSDAIRMPDGTAKYLIEAIEADPRGPYAKQFLIGTQFHPEYNISGIGEHLIRHLLEAARHFYMEKQ